MGSVNVDTIVTVGQIAWIVIRAIGDIVGVLG